MGIPEVVLFGLVRHHIAKCFQSSLGLIQLGDSIEGPEDEEK